MSLESIESLKRLLCVAPQTSNSNTRPGTSPTRTGRRHAVPKRGTRGHVNWFRELFGFEEGNSYSKNQARFKMEGEELVCDTAPAPTAPSKCMLGEHVACTMLGHGQLRA